jgi:hypothetical protein
MYLKMMQTIIYLDQYLASLLDVDGWVDVEVEVGETDSLYIDI